MNVSPLPYGHGSEGILALASGGSGLFQDVAGGGLRYQAIGVLLHSRNRSRTASDAALRTMET